MSDSDRLLSDAERDLFAKFFAGLEATGIVAVLLRNYEDFPRTIGHDLDVFIRRRDLPQADRLIRKLIAAAGGTVLIVHERDYFLDIRFVVDTSAAEAIHLDLYHGAFTWHGLPYLSEEELLASRGKYAGWLVPHPAHEALNIFFASVLWGGFFKARYQARIAELLAPPENRAEFNRCVQRAFGESGAPPFDLGLPGEPDKKLVRDYAVRLRRALRRQSFRHQPLAAAVRLGRYWRVEFGTFLHPKGLTIAVMGPEPSQNAVVLEGLQERIGELFGQTHRRIFGETTANGSLMKLFRQWLACWTSWPLRMRKPKAQVQLILSNGAAGDWWCQPARHGFGKLPGWLLKLAARCVPQPDFTFVLTTDSADRRYADWVKGGRRRRAVEAGSSQKAMLDCRRKARRNRTA